LAICDWWHKNIAGKNIMSRDHLGYLDGVRDRREKQRFVDEAFTCAEILSEGIQEGVRPSGKRGVATTLGIPMPEDLFDKETTFSESQEKYAAVVDDLMQAVISPAIEARVRRVTES
jgi:hypothetical protein